MDFQELELSLTGSIFGIIILGALGTALYIGISKILKLAITRWLPSGLSFYKKWTYARGYQQARVLSYFQDTEYQLGTISIIVYKAVKCLTFLVISGTSILLFFFLFFTGDQVLTWGSYFVLLVSIVCAFTAYNEYGELHHINSFMQDKALEELDEANKDNAADVY